LSAAGEAIFVAPREALDEYLLEFAMETAVFWRAQ